MDSLVQKCIQEVEAKKRSSVPWQFDHPYQQPYYVFNNAEWQTREPVSKSSPGAADITKLALYSWNIDFMLPAAQSRMNKALSHLESMVAKTDASTATVIYLQECVESDLQTVSSNTWIRSNFALTDLSGNNWQSGHYGTISLVDKRLPITSCFRVHYSKTRMERDVLIVDVRIQQQSIRLCNSHLESLALEPPFRIPQMKLIAEYMHDQSVDGAAVAGDFNAIQPFDKSLHSDNGLKDAYLELGGREDDASGHTWGQQAATSQRERFGTSRMDKVYFVGSLELLSFEKFGGDVCVEDQSEQDQIVSLGFDKPWITDHLGVKAVFGLRSIKQKM
ncbi:uncharacterized protein MYCFIDRAFT_65435 [Pseudocercospora fijiensis CIRAD86]|uniref:Endonuclease/exonuclease/phosphatase domain-containing protein n=1 Tax=Pseudocercospora fijiensis (strain CIRAD86) TaxID=383855 RepID=N1Q5L4_PSEFD|nr:uncharacterized protein MYCFIDRAFT_65435 [Pseudocercospora fijiensis CIRAD86]EME87245.1 hypothetical protein MYCFIDRAFT_65435 [Pseudocercospora fijiensis CIRAD86]